MKLKLLSYFFFLLGALDLFYKLFYGAIFDPDSEFYYEYVRPFITFTPFVFFAIGGIFLKEYSKSGGNGIGLYLAKNIVVSYGGNLYPLDRKGGGLDMVYKFKLIN